MDGMFAKDAVYAKVGYAAGYGPTISGPEIERQIREDAYYLSLERKALGLPPDPDSDWNFAMCEAAVTWKMSGIRIHEDFFEPMIPGIAALLYHRQHGLCADRICWFTARRFLERRFIPVSREHMC